MKCECGGKMKVVFVRFDGCKIYECQECGLSFGEETEEWFRKMQILENLSLKDKAKTFT